MTRSCDGQHVVQARPDRQLDDLQIPDGRERVQDRCSQQSVQGRQVQPGERFDENSVVLGIDASQDDGGARQTLCPIKAVREVDRLGIRIIIVAKCGNGIGEERCPIPQVRAGFNDLPFARRARDAEMELRGVQRGTTILCLRVGLTQRWETR